MQTKSSGDVTTPLLPQDPRTYNSSEPGRAMMQPVAEFPAEQQKKGMSDAVIAAALSPSGLQPTPNAEPFLLPTERSDMTHKIVAVGKDLKKEQSQSTTPRIIILGVNASLVAVHMIGNSLILTSLGSDDEAAAGLITSFQSFINGSTFGFLLSTGVTLGNVIGAHKAKTATNGDLMHDKSIVKRAARKEDSVIPSTLASQPRQDNIKVIRTDQPEKNALVSAERMQTLDEDLAATIKTSYAVGTGLSLLATSSFVALRFVLPIAVSPATGTQAGKFFITFAIGGFCEPMSGNMGLIITQVEKNVWLALALTAAYRLPALGLAHLFCKHYGMGAEGVGLGSSIAGLITLAGGQMLLFRKRYRDMQLYTCGIPNFKSRLKDYLTSGAKLSLQRVTEWGNVAIIAMIVGFHSNTALEALQPSIQINSFVGLALQGMGQSAMMFFGEDCKRKEGYLNEYYRTSSKENLDKYLDAVHSSKRVFYKNNLAGLALTGVLSGAIYLARDPLLDLFLGSDSSPEEHALAQSLLNYTMLGFFPDAVRIIAGGLLRGWGDLLYPTLVSLAIMTVVGVPVGEGIFHATDENFESYLWIRIVSIFLSAAFNTWRFFQHASNDAQLYDNALNFLPVMEALEAWEKPTASVDEVEGRLTSVVTKYGFTLDLHDASHGNIFAVVANMLDEQHTADSLRRLVARDIVDHMELVDEHGAAVTQLSESSDNTNRIVVDALSSVLGRDVIIVSSNDQFILMAEQKKFNKPALYVGHDVERNQYYALSGTPNREFFNFINSVRRRHSNTPLVKGSGMSGIRTVAPQHNGNSAANSASSHGEKDFFASKQAFLLRRSGATGVIASHHESKSAAGHVSPRHQLAVNATNTASKGNGVAAQLRVA
jgi:Na+-driven multidrug efflux pump